MIGEIAVRVEAVEEFVGQLAEFVGAMFAGQSGQLRFGFLAGLDVDDVRESVRETADDRDMASSELAVSLRFSGGRQHRCQRFAVERFPFAQFGGLLDTAGGLTPADQQPIGQRCGQFAAQFCSVSLSAELVDQRMLDRRQLTAQPFAQLQQGQPLGSGQRVE